MEYGSRGVRLVILSAAPTTGLRERWMRKDPRNPTTRRPQTSSQLADSYEESERILEVIQLLVFRRVQTHDVKAGGEQLAAASRGSRPPAALTTLGGTHRAIGTLFFDRMGSTWLLTLYRMLTLTAVHDHRYAACRRYQSRPARCTQYSTEYATYRSENKG